MVIKVKGIKIKIFSDMKPCLKTGSKLSSIVRMKNPIRYCWFFQVLALHNRVEIWCFTIFDIFFYQQLLWKYNSCLYTHATWKCIPTAVILFNTYPIGSFQFTVELSSVSIVFHCLMFSNSVLIPELLSAFFRCCISPY